MSYLHPSVQRSRRADAEQNDLQSCNSCKMPLKPLLSENLFVFCLQQQPPPCCKGRLLLMYYAISQGAKCYFLMWTSRVKHQLDVGVPPAQSVSTKKVVLFFKTPTPDATKAEWGCVSHLSTDNNKNSKHCTACYTSPSTGYNPTSGRAPKMYVQPPGDKSKQSAARRTRSSWFEAQRLSVLPTKRQKLPTATRILENAERGSGAEMWQSQEACGDDCLFPLNWRYSQPVPLVYMWK